MIYLHIVPKKVDGKWTDKDKEGNYLYSPLWRSYVTITTAKERFMIVQWCIAATEVKEKLDNDFERSQTAKEARELHAAQMAQWEEFGHVGSIADIVKD